LGYPSPVNPERDYEFWSQYPGVVWSNPDASDTVMIRNALVRPKMYVLRAVGARFGIERMRQEWKVLCEDPLMNLSPAGRDVVSRCLNEVEAEFQHAA
jgi:hypothetical protein